MNELKECLHVLVKEQQAVAVQAAASTLSGIRLKQRLAVLERYFIALSRSVLLEHTNVKLKTMSVPVAVSDKKRYVSRLMFFCQ